MIKKRCGYTVWYTGKMPRGLLLFLLLALTPQPLLAVQVQFLAPSIQYEVLSLSGDPRTAREIYGTLNEYPIMYELRSDQAFLFTAQVAQVAVENPVPFALMVVEALPDDAGVREVARMPAPQDWLIEKDQELGVVWQLGTLVTQELPAGTYWIEVSTPSNQGQFQLRVGTEARSLSYSERWSRVLAVNNFLNRSVFTLISSSFVQVHLLVVACFGGVLLLRWKYLTRRRSATKRFFTSS